MRTRKLLALVPVLAFTGLAALAPPASADESPGILDAATIQSAKVTKSGDVDVRLNLICPKKDTYYAFMSMLTVGSGAPDDIFSTTGGEVTGVCKGKLQTITLHLTTQPIDGVLYPAPRNCSPEYGVSIHSPGQAPGAGWSIDFDRGGADGGPDGPGPQLCLS
jgi:hypothetical protein